MKYIVSVTTFSTITILFIVSILRDEEFNFALVLIVFILALGFDLLRNLLKKNRKKDVFKP